MKDAIIVKKVTGPFSHEMIDRRKRNEKKSGIIFGHPVTDPRPCFSRRKNHDPDQKARTEDNGLFFKESRTEIRRRNKKRTSSLSERTRARNRQFCKVKKF